ncbi:MAG: D-arabinono-1,4-lactone oxidase [Kineosporiaceae bacterium]
MARRRRWTTWAHTHECHPRAWVTATSVPQVRAAVAMARRLGTEVRPAGAGRSGSALAMTEGVLLDTRGLDRVLAVDAEAGEVVAEPGITLRALSTRLAAAGLALETLGECDHATLGGAVATAMHASGAAFGSISSRVRELELVLADGSLVVASPTQNPRLYAAARVGLGAFGVLTPIRLSCVPAFSVHVQQREADLAEVLAAVEWLVAEHDHVELSWQPHAERAVVRTLDRLSADDSADAGAGALRRWRDRGGLALDASVSGPAGAPAAALAGRLGRGTDRVADSAEAFVRPHPVRYRESEFAVPRVRLADVLTDLRAGLRRAGARRGVLVRVRFGAPDDAWLAPTHARHSAYVAVRVPAAAEETGSLVALAEAVAPVDGRPSWHGAHGLDAATLAPRYPRFADAVAVRDEVDPTRVFTNRLLARVLGA